QTYQHLEVLVVDDCSTDKSLDVVLRLKEQHPNGHWIKVVRQPRNMGVSEARNVVIGLANGEYLYFLDSDDFVEAQTIEMMVCHAEDNNADVVHASSRTFIMRTGSYSGCYAYPLYKVVAGKGAFANLVCKSLRANVSTLPFNVLFRIQFLRRYNLKFFGRNSEEFLFFSAYYAKVERAVLMPDVTYYYVIRDKSLMGYNSRDLIPVDEIRERFLVNERMTMGCGSVKEESFYCVHCAKVMKYKFRAVCVALRHRKRFSEWLTDSEIHKELRHPASLKEILHFRRYRWYNLAFYIVAHLPSAVSVKLCYIVGKIIHWI
ncbi:MAG: glycosyltransferase family 2 protein, partial [Prevotella sp.]|nr:glycosyltransferase family 2 protein [Prevotella sp.]